LGSKNAKGGENQNTVEGENAEAGGGETPKRIWCAGRKVRDCRIGGKKKVEKGGGKLKKTDRN